MNLLEGLIVYIKDRINNTCYLLRVADGEVTLLATPDYIGYSDEPGIVDDVSTTVWNMFLTNGQIGIDSTGRSPSLTWVRDTINKDVVWEFHVHDEQLYILEIGMTGKGRVVYLLTGEVFGVYNVIGGLSKQIDITSQIYVNTNLSLNCLIPQEEYV